VSNWRFFFGMAPASRGVTLLPSAQEFSKKGLPMKTTIALMASALLLLAGCDTTDRTAKNSSTDSTKVTTARPAYPDSSTPSTAGTSDSPAVNSALPRSSDSALAPASTDKPGTAGPSSVQPDNSAVNERDRDPNAKTPIDQDENQRDVNITAEIRKAVVAHENMSINGQNVKIITSAGKVTLRGPVNSQVEKEVIDRIAKKVAGKDNVTNEIDVK
jgi:hyperosmotically inducible periplasmic protein